jgi:dTDP-4-dehydrorhamnose reductase
MILLIGSGGQLGRQMQIALTAKGQAFRAFDYPDIDIAQPGAMERLIGDIRPAAVVNCAAYTNVDKAEADEAAAYAINALGAKNLAQACAAADCELVHISTDYVFSGAPILEDGVPRPYVETDACAPATAYGRTKLAGERFVRESGARWTILRTAWLYGDGHNFVRTMLRLSETRSALTVVDDQIGSPTSTADLAEAVCALIGTGAYGLYHATCEGQCSWCDFAKRIFELSGRPVNVQPVTTEEYSRAYPASAPRPKWSVLENARLKEIGKNVFRHWADALKAYLADINREGKEGT